MHAFSSASSTVVSFVAYLQGEQDGEVLHLTSYYQCATAGFAKRLLDEGTLMPALSFARNLIPSKQGLPQTV